MAGVRERLRPHLHLPPTYYHEAGEVGVCAAKKQGGVCSREREREKV